MLHTYPNPSTAGDRLAGRRRRRRKSAESTCRPRHPGGELPEQEAAGHLGKQGGPKISGGLSLSGRIDLGCMDLWLACATQQSNRRRQRTRSSRELQSGTPAEGRKGGYLTFLTL